MAELGLKVVCCVPLLASESFAGCFQRPKTEQKKKSAQCRCLSRVVCNYLPSLRIANESVCNCRRLRAPFQLSEKQGNVTHVRKRDPAPTRLTGPATAPRSRLRHATSSMTFPRPVLPPARAANASGEGGISSAFDARGEPHREAWRLPYRLPDPENVLSNASFAAHVFRPSFS